MTNKQKAKRLEEMAVSQDRLSVVLFPADSRKALTDAALLRECAAMMREWGESEVQWDAVGGAAKNGLYLWAGPCVNGFASLVQRGRRRLYLDWHPTLEAAQAAAVAWVDEQEGCDA
jgi:hypothetical protein